MKTRKLKWHKDNDINDPIMNCCSWFAKDKKTGLDFSITYYIEDIVNDKFSVDLSVWLGTGDDPFIGEIKKTTKWSLERFEKFELKDLKLSLIKKTQEKLESLVEEFKRISV